MQELNDLSPMPFGKFKGRKMQDVPASYLHWLWSQPGFQEKDSPLRDYIRDNKDALALEYPDGIW